MPSIFSKNCVLMGEVDSYCLVCCKHLPAEHDVLEHIHDSKHKHNLKAHAYSKKLEKDCIKKVAGVYFCELCNITIPTATKVDLHVTEHTHLERKTGPMLTRADKCIMFQENILITENAWHGLVDDTCVLCNVEFEDESIHKFEQNHILNLIKSKVTFSANNDIYRQVDDIYHCLTCNIVVSTNANMEHFESVQHKSLQTKHDPKQDEVNQAKVEDRFSRDETADKCAAKDYSDGTNNPNEDLTTSMEDVPSDEDETKPIKIRTNERAGCSITKDLKNDTKLYGLTFIECATMAYIQTCNTYVSETLHTVKQCKTNKKRQRKHPVNKTWHRLPKVMLQEFIKMGEFIKFQPNALSKQIPFVLIKDKFFINVAKLIGLAKYQGNIICQFCHEDLTPQNWSKHINSLQHKSILENSHFITSSEEEVVRQLKPDLYDCTYCGHVEHDWDDMLDHLDTNEHTACKDEHESLLLGYKMSLIENHVQNSIPYNLLAMLNNMRLF